MRKTRSFGIMAVTLSALLVLGAVGSSVQKRENVQATAMGTGTQMGRLINIDLIINEYSTADDQKALLEAFDSKGSEGLANALDKMSAKGRIRITGTLGYDVNYIREFKLPDGSRKIRIVTDRPVTFGEMWAGSRSTDYDLSAAEIIISPQKGKNSGTLLPVCRFKLDKEKEIEIEALQNPWKLENIRISK